jgi:hypothetical protein
MSFNLFQPMPNGQGVFNMGYLKDGNGAWEEAAPDERKKEMAAEAAIEKMRSVNKTDLGAACRTALLCHMKCQGSPTWKEFLELVRPLRSSCMEFAAEFRRKRAGMTSRQRLYAPMITDAEEAILEAVDRWQYWQ